MTQTRQPVTDDSLNVRQSTHGRCNWRAGDADEPGTHVLQLPIGAGIALAAATGT